MRLIDADKFKGKAICNRTYGGVTKLVNVDNILTAYDLDKAEEQFEELKKEFADYFLDRAIEIVDENDMC